jgi:hypothetical protein
VRASAVVGLVLVRAALFSAPDPVAARVVVIVHFTWVARPIVVEVRALGVAAGVGAWEGRGVHAGVGRARRCVVVAHRVRAPAGVLQRLFVRDAALRRLAADQIRHRHQQQGPD